jgi:hypothetical protein|tara:strand:- start:3801 stop:4019 length:219 start_codon:yes stop_codon:yes gene_type:complete
MKKTKTDTIPYSEEALRYFQESNDNTEFMTEFMGNFDYMSYLLGEDTMIISGSFDDDVVEYNEMEDSDYYMD